MPEPPPQRSPDTGATAEQQPSVSPPSPSAPIPPALIAQILAQRANLPYGSGSPHVQQQAQIQLWQGQFPPPEAVQKYEEVLPGSFNRMIRMAETLQEAQIEEIKNAQSYTARDTKRGHWLGFSVTMASVLGAIVCTITAAFTHLAEAYLVAGALVSVPIMAVAKALVESTKASSAKDITQVTATGATPKDTTSPTTPPEAS